MAEIDRIDLDELIERLTSHMGKAEVPDLLRDCRLAADELSRLRGREEAGRQLANVAYNIGQLGHVTDAGSLRSLREAQLAFDAALSPTNQKGDQDGGKHGGGL